MVRPLCAVPAGETKQPGLAPLPPPGCRLHATGKPFGELDSDEKMSVGGTIGGRRGGQVGCCGGGWELTRSLAAC